MLDNLTLEKHLKKFQLVTNVWSLAIGIITAIGISYGFVYSTNSKLDDHTEAINNIEVKLGDIESSITNTAVYQGASKEQIKALENQVTDVKKSQERIEDKLDRLIMQNKN